MEKRERTSPNRSRKYNYLLIFPEINSGENARPASVISENVASGTCWPRSRKCPITVWNCSTPSIWQSKTSVYTVSPGLMQLRKKRGSRTIKEKKKPYNIHTFIENNSTNAADLSIGNIDPSEAPSHGPSKLVRPRHSCAWTKAARGPKLAVTTRLAACLHYYLISPVGNLSTLSPVEL